MTTFADQVAHHVMRLRPRAASLCRGTQDVDDLMQQTIVQALQSAHLFQEGTNLGAWTNTIMQRAFLDAARDRKFDRLTCPADDATLLVAHPTAFADVEHGVEMSRLSERVARLPERQRGLVVAVLCDGAGLPRSGAANRALRAATVTLAGAM